MECLVVFLCIVRWSGGHTVYILFMVMSFFSLHSGTAIMQDGNTMRNNYGCDLDSLTTGSRIGMMRSACGDLHYYINGVDQGVACSGLPPGKNHKVWECEIRTLLQTHSVIIPYHIIPVQIALSLSEVFAVIDLYGQCVQVSITSSSGLLDNSLCTSNITEKSFPIHSPGTRRLRSILLNKKYIKKVNYQKAFHISCPYSLLPIFILLFVCSSRCCPSASQ